MSLEISFRLSLGDLTTVRGRRVLMINSYFRLYVNFLSSNVDYMLTYSSFSCIYQILQLNYFYSGVA